MFELSDHLFTFNLFHLFIFLLIASICGAIGTSIAGFTSRGCLMNIAVGLIGAMIGSWISREFGIRELIWLRGIPILWTIAGSAIFVALIGMITSGNRHR